MATRPFAFVSTLKTPAPPPSSSAHPPPLLRRLQTLTRALASSSSSSSSPQAMASPSPPAKKASVPPSRCPASLFPPFRRVWVGLLLLAWLVLVPIANGTEPMEAVITIDVLRRAGAEVAVASVEPGSVQVAGAWGVKLAADALLSDLADAEFDLISLPVSNLLRSPVASSGGMPGSSNLRDCKLLENMVKQQAGKGKLYAAICAAPAVALGSWESRVQIDGNCVTSRGPGTAMEYSVVLVEQLYGKEKADEVAGPMVMRPQHGVEFSIKEFNSTSWNVGEAHQILVPIANGTEEMEATMIIDILRRAKANVVVASLEETLEVVASRKVKMIADVLFDDALTQQYDLILLPGGLGGSQAYANSDKLIGLIKKQAEANKLYGAICASPAIALEPHGLLKGKKATSFPAMWSKLSDQSECKNRIVVDGNLITSQGPGTSMEFSLAIVEKLFGRERAIELAKTMVFV
uniref:DJ-1/PfpI domain-containing protein n=1 Tax=Leersia perrieri TaxID=77586 RepID=A0A0D9WQW1_9ORYZ